MTEQPYPGGGRRRSLFVAGAATLVAAVVAARRRPVFRLLIEGVSMVPELAPGDRVLVARLPVLEPGDLVAVEDPEQPSRLLVKRVTGLSALEIEVEGDNTGASRDSRAFGPVSRRLVAGRVVARYRPLGALRWFRRRRAV